MTRTEEPSRCQPRPQTRLTLPNNLLAFLADIGRETLDWLNPITCPLKPSAIDPYASSHHPLHALRKVLPCTNPDLYARPTSNNARDQIRRSGIKIRSNLAAQTARHDYVVLLPRQTPNDQTAAAIEEHNELRLCTLLLKRPDARILQVSRHRVEKWDAWFDCQECWPHPTEGTLYLRATNRQKISGFLKSTTTATSSWDSADADRQISLF